MKEERNKYSVSEKAMQAYAALGVGFVCIIVGLPLWWKTTEVYRVQLPYHVIDELAMSKLSTTIDVTVVIYEENLSKIDLARFGEDLKNSLNNGTEFENFSIVYKGNIRKAYDEERQVYEAAKTLEELDAALYKVKLLKENGKYCIVILPSTSPLASSNIHVGKQRTTFLTGENGLLSVLDDFTRIIKEVGARQKATKESMRAVHTTPEYELTFSLLNPQPDMLAVAWPIAAAVGEYLDPLTEQFADFAKMNVKSQILHYTGLSVKTKKADKGSYLTEADLPHLINPIESQLSSHISNYPNLNFIVYIPSRDQSPLTIQHNSGETSKTNAFLSPQWGGILIYNVETPQNVSLPAAVEVDMKPVMQVFLAQLRLILGIPTVVEKENIKFAKADNQVVTLWELDTWLRTKTLENVAMSSTTLKSLAQLLEQIPNIVINDDIGMEVEKAVTCILKSHKNLIRGNLRDAFTYSKEALIASEKAFFDQSLLELLYFPEDQKFAIYIPLFLPISIPVLMSILQAVKWFRSPTNKVTKQE
ncbi:unnamed protein product [Owenia fusiformis]|uniref:GPI transamidase component PIG-S n=1 Tax=Owenia fusiformis TaxID=6347 RepID=A0A8S4P2N3_OWEFU|nr:unnamed protein product [Owenia fusiformis]